MKMQTVPETHSGWKVVVGAEEIVIDCLLGTAETESEEWEFACQPAAFVAPGRPDPSRW
jgi:hypothetical protein